MELTIRIFVLGIIAIDLLTWRRTVWARECDETDEFDCGNGVCIESLQRCDGVKDCPNSYDERQCSSRNGCTAKQFRCRNGQCLPLNYLCDDDEDCMDGSDEWPQNCPENKVGNSVYDNCEEDEFRCEDNGCIDKSLVCDGKVDCDDRSDEANCNESKTSLFVTTSSRTTPRPAPRTTPPYRKTQVSPFRSTVDEIVLHGNGWNPRPSYNSHEAYLLTLYRQSLDTLQRMAFCVGQLSETLRIYIFGRYYTTSPKPTYSRYPHVPAYEKVLAYAKGPAASSVRLFKHRSKNRTQLATRRATGQKG